MKREYNNKLNNEKKIAAPIVAYQGRSTLKIFNSFEEAKQDEIDFVINQSPIERLRHTVALILRVYDVSRVELKARNSFKQIKIIKRS